MKKIILVGVIAFAIGAIISPVAGMAINFTRSLILGMAPEEAILVLADKIDEQNNANEAQKKQIENIQQDNVQQFNEIERIKQEESAEQKEEYEDKKKECLQEYSALQEKMNRAKETLSEDHEDLEDAESGEYEEDCLKTQRDEEICEKNSKINLKSRKNDVQEDEKLISEIQINIDNLNNACAGYL